jgi:hypothetical protein
MKTASMPRRFGDEDLCAGKALKMKTSAPRRLRDKDLRAKKTCALRRYWRRRP